MIALGIVGYYAFAFALLAAVAWLSLRQNARDAERRYAELTTSPPVPPLAPWHPLPVSDPNDWSELFAPALQPIAPLLRRVVRQYVDHPAERERLIQTLGSVLDTVESA